MSVGSLHFSSLVLSTHYERKQKRRKEKEVIKCASYCVEAYLVYPEQFLHILLSNGSFMAKFQVEKTQCKNCLVWAKSDSLARDIIRSSSDIKVSENGF